MGRAQIREATSADLHGLAELLGHRDGLEGPHPRAARALLDLDPAEIRVWVAVDSDGDGERIVGSSCAELHRLQVGSDTLVAGYWTNLYIHEDYRDQLLYPRLPQAMLRALRKSGVERVYLAIRRLEVASAHLRIGFREISRIPLRLKPFRPASLAAKQLQAPDLVLPLASLVDRIAGLPARVLGWRPRAAPPGTTLVSLSPDDHDHADELAGLLADARRGRVTRAWDGETLRSRYRPAADSIEGDYSWLGLRRGDQLIAHAAYRIATREAGIRVGVLMELVALKPERDTLPFLLRSVERRLRGEGVDGVLALDALGPEVSRLLRQAGYLDTRERYVLMAAPKRKIPASDALLDPIAWRFPLSDHDAF